MLRGAAHSAPQPFYTIHVGNLSPAIHGDMLRSIFGHFGTIVDIRLIAQNGPASYGFVDYATEAAAQAALSMTARSSTAGGSGPVDELGAELGAARASAKKDRDFSPVCRR
ncbi:hypothetical protein JL722_15040 [Aureococcus anophagefferens]|nr:hypothetical protein JL722_15040 [Aureococcus anophagefferens]